MNAVIYARYSSHGQTEQSIEGQLRDCYEYAKREDLTVVGEYIDRAIPGKTDDRPDFQRMIADSRKRSFQYIIVWKLDRFARNRYDSAIYKHKLKANGVKVLSAMENIGDGDESIILEAVLEASAEYYSRDLSKKVKRGHRESALKNNLIVGTPPFGYKLIDRKTIAIDDERAPYIVRAFEEYADGVPKRKIIDELNAKGVKGLKGRALTLTSFQHCLKNPKYTGEYMFNDIVMTNYPALISKELFERVQSRLAEKAHAPAAAKAREEYLLQGKAYCGHCGAKMVGDGGTGKAGKHYTYYACAQKKRFKTCGKANEKKGFLEWYVVEQTVQYILTPARMKEIAAAVVAEYEKEFNNDAVAALERRIAKIERDIKSAVNMLIASGSSTLLKHTEQRVEELETQRADLEIDLSKLRIANGIRYSVEDITAWLRSFCKGDLMDAEFRRRIIDVFINSIYLYDDKIAIFYNVKNGRQVSFVGVADALDGEADGDDGAGMADGGVRISNLNPRTSVKLKPNPQCPIRAARVSAFSGFR